MGESSLRDRVTALRSKLNAMDTDESASRVVLSSLSSEQRHLASTLEQCAEKDRQTEAKRIASERKAANLQRRLDEIRPMETDLLSKLETATGDKTLSLKKQLRILHAQMDQLERGLNAQRKTVTTVSRNRTENENVRNSTSENIKELGKDESTLHQSLEERIRHKQSNMVAAVDIFLEEGRRTQNECQIIMGAIAKAHLENGNFDNAISTLTPRNYDSDSFHGMNDKTLMFLIAKDFAISKYGKDNGALLVGSLYDTFGSPGSVNTEFLQKAFEAQNIAPLKDMTLLFLGADEYNTSSATELERVFGKVRFINEASGEKLYLHNRRDLLGDEKFKYVATGNVLNDPGTMGNDPLVANIFCACSDALEENGKAFHLTSYNFGVGLPQLSKAFLDFAHMDQVSRQKEGLDIFVKHTPKSEKVIPITADAITNFLQSFSLAGEETWHNFLHRQTPSNRNCER